MHLSNYVPGDSPSVTLPEVYDGLCVCVCVSHYIQLTNSYFSSECHILPPDTGWTRLDVYYKYVKVFTS